MRRITFLILTCLCLVEPVTDADQLAQAIFTAANKIRQNAGLEVLQWDNRLALVAIVHSKDMMDRNFQSHYNPEGEGPADRLRRLYPELLGNIGENICGVEVQNGTLDTIPILAEEAVAGWFASTAHRMNLLNPNWTHMSIGAEVHGESYYATQLFTEEFVVLDNPLPASATLGSSLKLSGKVLGRWRLDKLEIFLILPDPQAIVRISETHALMGVMPLDVKLSGDKFQVETILGFGEGVYAIGFGQSGAAYFPVGHIAVK